MQDLLSQDEIDALLHGVDDGEIETEGDFDAAGVDVGVLLGDQQFAQRGFAFGGPDREVARVGVPGGSVLHERGLLHPAPPIRPSDQAEKDCKCRDYLAWPTQTA